LSSAGVVRFSNIDEWLLEIVGVRILSIYDKSRDRDAHYEIEEVISTSPSGPGPDFSEQYNRKGQISANKNI
jgi:hypothetical protein